MVLALTTESNLVRRLTRGLNQPAVLEFEQAVSAYDTSIALGDTVKLYDNELDYVFFGKVTEINRNFSAGEGIVYKASDHYFDLNTQFTKLMAGSDYTRKLGFSTTVATDPSTFLPIHRQTILQALTLVLNASGIQYDAVSLAALAGVTDYLDDVVSKGGATYDDWLSDLLALTDAGMAYVLPYGALGEDYRLYFKEFASNGAGFTIEVGSLEAGVTITPGGNPCLLRGNLAEKLSTSKVKTLTFEGIGRFRRVSGDTPTSYPAGYTLEQFGISPVCWEIIHAPDSPNQRRIRFHVFAYPFVASRFIHEVIHDQTDFLRVTMDLLSGGVPVGNRFIDTNNDPTITTNDDYIECDDQWSGVHGWFSDNLLSLYGYSYSKIYGWFTAMEAPMIYTVTNPTSDLEGERVELHEQYFHYENRDSTFIVSMDTEFQDYCTEKAALLIKDDQRMGSLDLHISGFNANVLLGSKVLGPAQFADLVVNQIQYDFRARTMLVSLSPNTLRKELEERKYEIRIQREQGADNFVMFYKVPPDVSNAFTGIRHLESGI